MTNETDDNKENATAPARAPMDPVRKWTLIVLGACVVMMFWYLRADRVTPYTSQARVHALVVPIAPQVSGIVTDVFVGNNEMVAAGQELFRIDSNSYQLAVETAQANLQSARQATGVSTANVSAAQAAVESSAAALVRAEQDAIRLRRIKEEDPGAISDRRIEQAEASLSVAISQLSAAEANLEKARQDLGDSGEQNVRILQAQVALDAANLDLARTTVYAPTAGVVTDVRLDRGNFAAAGAPQMTFIGVNEIWIQADFTENNLGHIQPGNEVEIVFDALPGKVLGGKIRSTGFGVAVSSAPLGSLPTVENDRQWLRDAQRYPVQVAFELRDTSDREAIRVGAQASVIVYTGRNWLFNLVGKLYIRLVSIVTYAV